MTTAQAARIEQGRADVDQPGPLEEHAAQGTDQLGERQGLDEGLGGRGEPVGREEDAREEPHRQHDQVHQPADRLGCTRHGRRPSRPIPANASAPTMSIPITRARLPRIGMWNMRVPRRSRTARSGITKVSRAPRSASKKSRRGMGVATNRLSSLAIRKLTSKEADAPEPAPHGVEPDQARDQEVDVARARLADVDVFGLARVGATCGLLQDVVDCLAGRGGLGPRRVVAIGPRLASPSGSMTSGVLPVFSRLMASSAGASWISTQGCLPAACPLACLGRAQRCVPGDGP